VSIIGMVFFPARVAVAFGQASIGVAKLVDPDGPIRLAYVFADILSPDRPIGQALARGGLLDRLLAEESVLVRLAEPGGALDRLIAEGGAVERALANDGPLNRVIEPGGLLDRLVEQEGPIDRMLAEDGVIDRLLAKEGLIEQLVETGGIIDRLASVMETIDRLGPVFESLDPSIRGIDNSAAVLAAIAEPLRDVAVRLPGLRRRMPPLGPDVGAAHHPGMLAASKNRSGDGSDDPVS